MIIKEDYDARGKHLSEKVELVPEGTGLVEGKVTLITGATLGIGLAMATLFAQHRAKVIITGIEEEIGEYNANFLRECGCDVVYKNANAFKRDEIKALFDYIKKEYGRIDILINSAGYNIPSPFMDATESQFRQLVGIHGLAHCYTLWEAIPMMKEQGGGTILEFGSKSTDRPGDYDPFYCLAKAGAGMMAKSLNMEFGRFGIRINCICPGPTITGMTQDNDGKIVDAFEKGGPVLKHTALRKIAMPIDIAKAAIIICSDYAGYVAGLTYNVDGGIVI